MKQPFTDVSDIFEVCPRNRYRGYEPMPRFAGGILLYLQSFPQSNSEGTNERTRNAVDTLLTYWRRPAAWDGLEFHCWRSCRHNLNKASVSLQGLFSI